MGPPNVRSPSSNRPLSPPRCRPAPAPRSPSPHSRVRRRRSSRTACRRRSGSGSCRAGAAAGRSGPERGGSGLELAEVGELDADRLLRGDLKGELVAGLGFDRRRLGVRALLGGDGALEGPARGWVVRFPRHGLVTGRIRAGLGVGRGRVGRVRRCGRFGPARFGGQRRRQRGDDEQDHEDCDQSSGGHPRIVSGSCGGADGGRRA